MTHTPREQTAGARPSARRLIVKFRAREKGLPTALSTGDEHFSVLQERRGVFNPCGDEAAGVLKGKRSARAWLHMGQACSEKKQRDPLRQ